MYRRLHCGHWCSGLSFQSARASSDVLRQAVKQGSRAGVGIIHLFLPKASRNLAPGVNWLTCPFFFDPPTNAVQSCEHPDHSAPIQDLMVSSRTLPFGRPKYKCLPDTRPPTSECGLPVRLPWDLSSALSFSPVRGNNACWFVNFQTANVGLLS